VYIVCTVCIIYIIIYIIAYAIAYAIAYTAVNTIIRTIDLQYLPRPYSSVKQQKRLSYPLLVLYIYMFLRQ
jgi:hypothetical protein